MLYLSLGSRNGRGFGLMNLFTPFREIAGTPGGMLLITLAMILLPCQVSVCMRSLHMRRRAPSLLLCALHAALGYLVLWCMMDCSFAVFNDGEIRQTFPGIVEAAGRIPWSVFALLEAVSILVLDISRRRCRKFLRSHPGPQMIKEAVDLLPAGVCFGAADGSVLLANVRMSALAREITGRMLTDTNRFRKAVEEHCRKQGGSCLLRTGDGKAWLLDRRTVSAGGEEYDQFTAADVTEPVQITDRLEENNRRLRDVQARMRAFTARETDLNISREILAARSVVHNHMGNFLLLGRYYLDGNATDEASLLRTMRSSCRFLVNEVEQPEEPTDPWEAAMKTAAGIGVKATVDGQPPEKAEARALAAKILEECAANAYKHAGTDRIGMAFRHENAGWIISVTNGGSAPEGPVRETGGLATLRRMAQEAGGTMRVETEPEFRLTVTVPEKAGKPK